MGSGYSRLAEKLVEFNELKQLRFQLERLDERKGIEMTLVANDAWYYQSCKLKYNNTKLKRVKKRALKSDGDEDLTPCKRSRSNQAF